MTYRIFAAASVLLLSGLAALAVAQPVPRASYIVQLRDAPVASYTGNLPGLPPTRPPAGQPLDMNAQHVQAYLDYLKQKQQDLLSSMGNLAVIQRYDTAFNGFSALLTDAQVRQLKSHKDVASVQLDKVQHLLTDPSLRQEHLRTTPRANKDAL